ncbi:type II secretion system F family protein [Geodermatophilus sp. Leaf369]|uniref:type II secretion system F family protein n=1 Tax=Geodermatophilus sp. Leaf369 TaxID=1736354 RepID=UPI000AE1C284|nr:type II secretion system F family protein [Geodermatophilus sp. Leaf369]
MPALVWAAVAAVVLGIGGAFFVVVAAPGRPPGQIALNLTRSLAVPGVPGMDATGDRRRGGAGALLRTLTPESTARRVRRLQVRAGSPAAWPVEKLLWGKLVLAGVGGLLGVLYLLSNSTLLAVLLVPTIVAVLYFLPELLLHSRGQERQAAITLELADTLDQMTIAVEAGLGFEAAMARAGRNGKGPLAQELVRTVQDIAVGRPRREAYRALAERTQVTDLKRFVGAVNQADAYGVSIADVLRTQAGEMRLKRRQRAEEKAMQIPVKVIFPLMLFILPTLFIVLLGPAVLDMMANF